MKVWRNRGGRLVTDDLVALVGPKTRFVTVSLVSFYNGFTVRLPEVVAAVRKHSPALLAVDASGRIVPSRLAKDLKAWGFDIITWTFERADLRQGASKAGFYYDFDPLGRAIRTDSDMYKALDVLAREVKILGIFSDWPATVTYYANCMGMK